jgi:hypothetical protein
MHVLRMGAIRNALKYSPRGKEAVDTASKHE